jgi:hypothetical protein
MKCAVMCCGCGRYLAKDGTAIEPKGMARIISTDRQIVLPGAADEAVEYFDSPPAADAAALQAGWIVRDAEGPNHRCPDCKAQAVLDDYQSYQRGAILQFDDRGEFLGPFDGKQPA